MSGSADEASVVAVETKQENTASEPIAPKQLREFDARVVQQLPDLSKEEMQHLIEHPDELRARLAHYGVAKIKSGFPRSFLENYKNPHRLDSWADFYAEEFGVDPDFSRIRLPDMRVFTYTTPVRVATRLPIAGILTAIAKHEVDVEFRNSLTGLSSQDPIRECVDMRPDSENYLASFSMVVREDIPRLLKDMQRCRGTCMTLREYLLWLAYSLYLRDTPRSYAAHATECLNSCHGNFSMLGSMYGDEPELAPNVAFGKHGNGRYVLSMSRGIPQRAYDRCNLDFLVRRVKIWKSLPQI